MGVPELGLSARPLRGDIGAEARKTNVSQLREESGRTCRRNDAGKGPEAEVSFACLRNNRKVCVGGTWKGRTAMRDEQG